MILDNWFYFAIALLMWRLPHFLGDYFNQEIQPSRPQGNQPVFWMGIFIQLYIFAILAMSYNLIFGFAGILSFGHALYFGIGTYIVLILLVDYGRSLEASLIVALAISALFGLLTALAIFRIKGVYFAMFTLALAQVFFELSRVNLFKAFTNGEDGRTLSTQFIPPWLDPIRNRLTFYYLAAFMVVLTFLFIRRLMNSPTGKAILAIRDNEERAKTMGYNTALYKMAIISFASLIATLSGALHVLFNRGTDPTNLGLVRTVDPLFMTIIGGVGTNPGPVIGAVFLKLGEHFFRKPDLKIHLDFILFEIETSANTVSIWRLILGVVFVMIVLVAPLGVVGQLNKIWLQIRRWIRQYLYDPQLRANPNLAERMQPLTGEPPIVALALAEQSRDLTISAWARAYPWVATYTIGFALASLLGLLTWSLTVWFSFVLLLLLLTLPPQLILALRKRFEERNPHKPAAPTSEPNS